METKICTKCNIEKFVNLFHSNKRLKNGLNSHCKDCVNLYRIAHYKKNKIEINKKRYEKNKEQIKANSKKYSKENRETLNKKRAIYNAENKEALNKKRRENWAKNRESLNKKRREEYKANKKNINIKRNTNVQSKKKKDPIFKAKLVIRSAIYNALRKKNLKKENKTEQILGLTITEFILYLESKFEYWMNWNNYGLYNGELNYGWDIDHIKPLYLAKTKEEVINLNHYTNLQPLCSKINRDIKWNKNIY